MHDDGVASRGHDSADEFLERRLFGGSEPRRRLARGFPARHALAADLRAIDHADTKFHGHGNRHRVAHRGTHSATSDGFFMRQAPNAPECTRSLGQPQLRLISS